MKTTAGLLIILTVLFAAHSANAQSTLALQEKCSEGAKRLETEKMNQPYPYGAANPCLSFQNHYNGRLDRCFLRVGYIFGPQEGEHGQTHMMYGDSLFDVFEDSKPVGELVYTIYRTLRCYVKDTQCKSRDEFEALVRPYMEQ
jgi:hypothetical protein